MSAFEPQLPTEPKVDMPDFMVVLRGFDRRQVEMWAAEVASQIEQERQRADEAEKRAYRAQIENKGAPSFSHLGTHVASIAAGILAGDAMVKRATLDVVHAGTVHPGRFLVLVGGSVGEVEEAADLRSSEDEEDRERGSEPDPSGDQCRVAANST